MHRPTQKEIKDILTKHTEWLESATAKGERACFEGKDLSNMVFDRRDLRGAWFADCNCAGTSFVGALLSYSYFRSTRLAKADFTDADCDEAEFEGNDTTGLILIGTQNYKPKVKTEQEEVTEPGWALPSGWTFGP